MPTTTLHPTTFIQKLTDPTLITTCQHTQPHRIMVLTDDHVKPLYANTLMHHLANHGLSAHLISIPPGEPSKSRKMKASIEDQMQALGCGQDTLLIALGGGMITDLGGFVAATYMRGIPVLYIPTTLLAMVDAAIGGKTGVNTPHGKNLIGTFTQPAGILIDVNTLRTLPENDYRYAFSEIIKHALIHNRDYFDHITRHMDALHQRDMGVLKNIIAQSIKIKSDIVSQDACEKNLRAILNFGHTIGHAIEHASDYAIPHGQAVGIGMLIESDISHAMGYLDGDSMTHIGHTIVQCIGKEWLYTEALAGLSQEKIWQALAHDKKSRGGTTRFVLLDSIGQAHARDGLYTHAVPDEIVRSAMRGMRYAHG